VLELRIW